MADFEDPRLRSEGDPDAIDDVYGLEPLDLDDEGHEPDGDKPPPQLQDDEDGPAGLDDARPNPAAGPPAPAPLPRLWKVAPEPETDRPVRRPPPEKKREASKAAPPPAAPARSEPAPRRRAPEPAKPPPASPSARGHRGEGGQIERVGRVTKPSEKEAQRARPEKRPRTRDESERKDQRGRESSNSTDSEKKALLEETPEFDTYQARQRSRIIVGVLAGAVCAVLAIFVAPSWLPDMSSEEPAGETESSAVATAPQPAPQPTREQLEQEARNLYERAHEAARRGDAKLAVSFLDRVVATYPNTPSAADAREALARPERNLPLFVDSPVVVASEVQSKPQPPSANAKVVQVTTPEMPKGGTAEVGLVLPANPAEASVGTSPQPVDPAAPPAPIGRPLPRGFRARPGTMVHETGWALEIIGDRDGAPMVLVPGGEFTMGTDDGDLSERPAHAVFVSTFYIDQHEVTVRQFDLFQKEIGRRIDRVQALERDGTPPPPSEDFPVVMVNAKEAKDFATWAGKRLPTEAQWEKAARGPDGRLYPWGPQPAEWKTKREPRQIERILSRAEDVSPYGAYDMAGNAWEWTKDWYDPRYFHLAQKQRIGDPTGPTNPSRAHLLTVKGGSNTGTATRREGLKYDTHLRFVGFRCVLPVEGPDNAFEPPPKPAPTGGAAQPGAPDGGATPPPF